MRFSCFHGSHISVSTAKCAFSRFHGSHSSVSTAKCAFSRFHGFTFHFPQNKVLYFAFSRHITLSHHHRGKQDNYMFEVCCVLQKLQLFSEPGGFAVHRFFFGLSATLKKQFRFETFGKHHMYMLHVCVYLCMYVSLRLLSILIQYSFNLKVYS